MVGGGDGALLSREEVGHDDGALAGLEVRGALGVVVLRGGVGPLLGEARGGGPRPRVPPQVLHDAKMVVDAPTLEYGDRERYARGLSEVCHRTSPPPPIL